MSMLFGINSVQGRLQSPKGIKRLLIREGNLNERLQGLLDLAARHGVPVEHLTIDEFAKLTRVNHQGIGLEVDSLRCLDEAALYGLLDDSQGPLLLLLLDGVTDPRNLGACIRSAVTFGADAIIQPKDRSAALNDAAIKTASGAAAAIPVIEVVNLARAMDDLKQHGVWLVGTTLDAEQSLAEIALDGHIGIVMGSEDRGIRARTAKQCDYLASIPMQVADYGLNVSVAAGISLYEATRQRQGGS